MAMRHVTADRGDGAWADLDPADADYAAKGVDRILSAARAAGASDLHLQPTAAGLELKFRTDGVLHHVRDFPAQGATNLVSRLKVLAGLLTYHNDIPQEGRIRDGERGVEIRVSTFPTLHGERAVVRLFADGGRFGRLDDLGLHDDLDGPLRRYLAETSGAVLVSGPAGSGKTTTAYAGLREIAADSAGRRSLVSLEDPIEVALDGVAQSQVNSQAGFDLATGLRYMMRQDPEVILVGEMRDRATAEAALQASLTGHLLLSTFHAGTAAETIGRLLDMGVEPYVLRSGLLTVLCQRLARRLCTCAEPGRREQDRLELPVDNFHLPVGCEACDGSGYRGRFLLVEMLPALQGELARAVLSKCDTSALEHIAVEAGMVTRWTRALRAVEAGWTSPAEVRRILGFSEQTDGRG